MKFVYLVSLFMLLASCANQGAVRIAPDTYLISKTDKGGIFGNASRMKAKAIQEANDFAESQGKAAIAISSKETPMRPGQFATFEYQFRVVDKSDPEFRRVTLKERPDLVIEDNKKIDVTINKNELPEEKDLYNDLIKLEDLRERGILTQEEFEAEKKKLLAN